MLPDVIVTRREINITRFPDIVGGSGHRGEVHGVLPGGKALDTVCATGFGRECAAIEMPGEYLRREIKMLRHGVGVGLNDGAVLHMRDLEITPIGEPEVLVGAHGRQRDGGAVAFGQSAVIQDITAVVGVAVEDLVVHGIGRVIEQTGRAVHAVVFRRLDLMGEGGGLDHGALRVDRQALIVYLIPVNEQLAAAHGDLGLREFGFGITAEVVDVGEGGLLIREKRFTSGRVTTGLDGDPVLHDGLILLADVADRPVNGAGRGVIGGRALTDVDVGVACSIDGHIGRDDGRGVLEDKLNFVTHRVGDGAGAGRNGNAARN